MPLTMTVRPPLTLPVTVPVHDVRRCPALFRATSHAARRLALSRDRMRVAIAVFERFDRDGDEIAGLDFDLALVVLEFFDAE